MVFEFNHNLLRLRAVCVVLTIAVRLEWAGRTLATSMAEFGAWEADEEHLDAADGDGREQQRHEALDARVALLLD